GFQVTFSVPPGLPAAGAVITGAVGAVVSTLTVTVTGAAAVPPALTATSETWLAPSFRVTAAEAAPPVSVVVVPLTVNRYEPIPVSGSVAGFQVSTGVFVATHAAIGLNTGWFGALGSTAYSSVTGRDTRPMLSRAVTDQVCLPRAMVTGVLVDVVRVTSVPSTATT